MASGLTQKEKFYLEEGLSTSYRGILMAKKAWSPLCKTLEGLHRTVKVGRGLLRGGGTRLYRGRVDVDDRKISG